MVSKKLLSPVIGVVNPINTVMCHFDATYSQDHDYCDQSWLRARLSKDSSSFTLQPEISLSGRGMQFLPIERL